MAYVAMYVQYIMRAAKVIQHASDRCCSVAVLISNKYLYDMCDDVNHFRIIRAKSQQKKCRPGPMVSSTSVCILLCVLAPVATADTCLGGWPLFPNRTALMADKWGAYYTKVYGEVPSDPYP